MFKKGKNILNIDTKDFFNRSQNHIYSLEVVIGDISVRKKLTFNINIDVGENLELKKGKVYLKNKDFREEYYIKTTYEYHKYFDKKYFYKKSLLNIGVGLVVFAGNSILP